MDESKDKKGNEVLGLLLIALGLFLALSFIPPQWAEGRIVDEVGSENLAGPLGQFLKGLSLALFGWGAYCVPILFILWGSNRFTNSSIVFPLRLTALLIGGSLLLSSSLAIPASDPGRWGWLPALLSRWFAATFGIFGSYLVIGWLALVLVIVMTGLRMEPLVTVILRASAWVLRRISGGAVAGATAWAEWHRERRMRRRAEKEKRVKKRLGKLPSKSEAEREEVRMEEEKVEAPPLLLDPVEESRTVSDKTETWMPETARDGYSLPPLSLLKAPEGDGPGMAEEDKEKLARVLVEKLADFHVRGEVVDIVSGPVITMFELKPAPGIKVSQIHGLADDLALALKVQKIRVVAPIPGKGAIGIEVPNPRPEVVRIREIIGSERYQKSPLSLPLVLGKDIVGQPVVADLATMPHLLIAGATGSGKSVNIHCLVMGFLYRFLPDDLSLIMIDPKMLELGTYNGIPHLLVPVVTDPKEAVKTLKWAVREMEERYTLLAAKGVRSIPDYNRRVASAEGGGKLPFLVIIIDELADLILTMQNEVEEPLARLAQMARGVGIHLILATQRPSVDVITGTIKANFPSRISFQVATKTDSRTILDVNGAEKLLGKGDMLFLPGGSANPIRIHGAFISDQELEAVVGFVREQLDVGVAEESGRAVTRFDEEPGEEEDEGERDELFDEAIKLVIRYGHGSTSLLQRRLKIGYTRAARIIDQLEAAEIVGPPDGSKAREVIVDESYLREKGLE